MLSRNYISQIHSTVKHKDISSQVVLPNDMEWAGLYAERNQYESGMFMGAVLCTCQSIVEG